MFERMTLGGKLLEALGRPQMVKSRPVAGLADLGLSWHDLVVPDKNGEAIRGSDLVPLAKVGLNADDTAKASDHKPVVVDLMPVR